MRIISSRRFKEQAISLSDDAKSVINEKLDILLQNPFHFKRLHYPGRHMFTVRFSDRRKAKRLIYELKEETVILWCILDRDNDYKDLRQHLGS